MLLVLLLVLVPLSFSFSFLSGHGGAVWWSFSLLGVLQSPAAAAAGSWLLVRSVAAAAAASTAVGPALTRARPSEAIVSPFLLTDLQWIGNGKVGLEDWRLWSLG